MADAMFMFGVAAGLFAFLAAVTFGSRGARKRRAPVGDNPEPNSNSSGGSKKAKKFKSDGTPLYE